MLIRRLWAEPLVDFKGAWHTIPDAGLNPLPVRRSIPIWFGGHHENVLRRAARLADGWMPNYPRLSAAQASLDMLHRLLEEAGRPWSGFGLEPRLSYGAGDSRLWEAVMAEWQGASATHLTFNTMGSGFQTPQEHIQAIRKFAAVALK